MRARDLGVPRDVGTLIALAYRDGVVTEREREDLDLGAEALGVEGVDKALTVLSHAATQAAASRSVVGLSVCFTGALVCQYDGEPLTRERAHALAERAGLVIEDRVTRRVDLLVMADPDSSSGKARLARRYGTRIVAETAFWPMIGIEVN